MGAIDAHTRSADGHTSTADGQTSTRSDAVSARRPEPRHAGHCARVPPSGEHGVRTQRVDMRGATRAAAALLDALGADTRSDGLCETPARMAHAYAELLTPEPFDVTTFPNDEGYDELVVARSIPFVSLCEHHLLPFCGGAHVGYLPGQRLVGLSKLARVVDHFARRLQVQERLTTQVADWLSAELHPRGVGVVLEAEHMCMSLRGARAQGTKTVTSALKGLLREDERTRAEFLAIVR